MTGDRGDLEAIASEILRYLARRPKASDTMDGIIRWWLPRIRLEEAAETVQQALDLLEKKGLVEQVRIAPERVLYRGLKASPRAGESHG